MIGRSLLHFEIIEHLGEGSMGVVYKARDTKLDRLVALKVLPSYLLTSADAVARFEREAKAISALNHPNIATIYALEKDQGFRFLVLEYLPGGTLREKTRKAIEDSAGLDAREILRHGIQIARALAHAHAHGIVHRDVKTDNVLLTQDGSPKVTDFGVAKLQHDISLSEEGPGIRNLIGTMAYMSPEQIQGEAVDERADVYALGVVLYEVSTGALPFQPIHEAALQYDIVNTPAPPLEQMRPDLPRELGSVIARCMQKAPGERYQKMAEAAEALEALADELRPPTRTVTGESAYLDRTMADLSIGSMIGQYRLQSKIGEGGMGVVYRALDTRLGRQVAVKVLHAQAVANSQRKRRFVQEARAASGLNHPNIVTIHDINEISGVHFIAMEYVAGETLDQHIAERALSGPGLPLRDTLRIAVQAADALAAAHAAAIVHRDIKPANIMTTEDGRVKLLDFGLAKLTESAPGETNGSLLSQDSELSPHTEEGAILGTVAYMSPEQAEGKPVDARSDIFSFGSVLYEMLTGRRAFRGESKVSVLAGILREQPKPPSELVAGLPAEVERVVERCLRKDPERRFQSMADLKVTLGDLRDDLDAGRLKQELDPTSAADSKAEIKRRDWVGIAAGVVLGIAAMLWINQLAPSASDLDRPIGTVAADMSLAQFTVSHGLANAPSWSPDGERIVYASDQSGNMDLWEKSLRRGEEIQLTHTPEAETNPNWSPDGRTIAFSRSGEERGLYLLPAGGGSPARITEFGDRPRFSPDGSRIAFDWNGTIYVVASSGGEPRPVVTATAGAPYAEWKPDGTGLVYWDRTSADIYSVALDGGEPIRWNLVPTGESVEGISFAPSGDALIYSVGAFGGNKNLFRAPLDPSGMPAGSPQRLTVSASDDIHCAYSPQGDRVAFTVQSLERHLWRIERDPSTGVAVGGSALLTFSSSRNYYPAVSPDGGMLVWTSQNAGQGSLFYRTLGRPREDSTEPVTEQKVTREWDRNVREVGASFHPSGEQIAFSSTLGGAYQIWRMPKLESVALQVTKVERPVRDAMTAWSPDGSKIAFYSNRGGNFDIWTTDPAGKDLEQWTDWESSELYPTWSPDGKRMAFVSTRGGNTDIWVIDVETRQARPFVADPAEEGHGAWSPDGKYFYFISNRGGTFELWVMPGGGGEAKPAFSSGGQSLTLPDVSLYTKFAVTQDALIVPLESRSGEIYLLEKNVESQ